MSKEEGFMSILNRYRLAVTTIGLMLVTIFALVLIQKNYADQVKNLPDSVFVNSGKPNNDTGRILISTKATNKLAAVTREHGLRKSANAQSGLNKIGFILYDVDSSQTTDEAVAAVKAALKTQDRNAIVEADTALPPSLVPNDPYYSSAWHLPKIKAPTAWDTTTGNSAVKVAILDSGVDCTHSDLSNLCIAGYNFYDNNTTTTDVYGHGTKVAGTAAAITNNSAGIASLCWQCSIMPIRVTGTDGYAYLSMLANGLTWSADRGARVANMSFDQVGSYATVTNAAKYFQSKGGVVTGAAGNNGPLLTWADNPYELTVSATDSNDVKASFSNSGTPIDIAAPGVSIYSTIRGGGYGAVSGTSFSAPVVAGVAALMEAANSNLNGVQLRSILIQTADDIGTAGWDSFYGWGRINAANAVAAAKNFVVTPDTTSPSAPSNLTAIASDSTNVSLSWTASSDNVGVTSYQIYRDGVQIGTSTQTRYADSGLNANTNYSYYVKALDAAGNASAASNTALVKTPNTGVSILNFYLSSKTSNSMTTLTTTSIGSTETILVSSKSGKTTKAIGTFSDTNLGTSHTIVISGLTPRTTYILNVTVTGQDGSKATTSLTAKTR